MKKKLLVIKVGGKVVENPEILEPFLQAFAQLEGAKILVHGGGSTATRLAERLGIEAPLVGGRRITNADMLDIAVQVYGGLVNKRVVSKLQAYGLHTVGLTGADMNVIEAIKRPVKEIDYGFAGDIVRVNAEQLIYLLNGNIFPVMAPITHDKKGQLLNTNADTIAQSVAVSLSGTFEVSLVYCFEREGVLDGNEELIPSLNPASYDTYKAEGAIVGGMIPKLDNAFAAIAQGVSRVIICHHGALRELSQSKNPGTRISQ